MQRTPHHDQLPAKVRCENCQHLRRNPNQPAGLALCRKFNGYNWPLVERRCRWFEERTDD